MGNAQQREEATLQDQWHFSARSVFITTCCPDSRARPLMELWISLRARGDRREHIHKREGHRACQPRRKEYYNTEQTSRTPSRLKLIEIPFEAFEVFCVVSRFQCSQSEQGPTLNKQIRLHLWRQASQICMAIISSSEFVI